MSEKKLRKYQERALEAFNKWYSETSSKVQMDDALGDASFSIEDRLATIILAMGLGKTFSTVACVKSQYSKGNKIKVLWAAHREELIKQAYDEFKENINDIDIQIEMADKCADSSADIVVGSVQTLARSRQNMNEFEPDLIVIDEFHHYHEKNTQYNGLLQKYPKAKILGLTATPYRFIGGDLPLGKVLINVDIGLGIQHGYLVTPKPEVLRTQTSLAKVKSRAGDFALDQLAKTVDNKDRNWQICKRLIQAVQDEGRKGIVYAASVQHAKNLSEILRKAGLRIAEIYGETPKEERRELMKKIHAQEIDLVVNNLVLTEGTNIPHINMICMARPTKSLGLFCQAIGRGLRLHPGKEDCLIIDVFDKVKATQGVATYRKVAAVGDIDGSRRRTDAIMKEPIAEKLSNFPVVTRLGKGEKWQLDNHTWFSSAFVLDTNQWVSTWSKRTERVQIPGYSWEPIKYTPKKTFIQNKPMEVKHPDYGEGIAHDITYGNESHYLSVDFGQEAGTKNIPMKELMAKYEKFEHKKLDNPIKRALYIITNDSKTYCRVISLLKTGKEFEVQSDIKGDKTTVDEVLRSFASEDNMTNIVKGTAQWKKKPASAKQKQLIKNFITWGKLDNDIDFDTLTGGDASAIMDQIDWKPIINSLFGARSKESLIGYMSDLDDV